VGNRLRHCTELHGCSIALSRVEGPEARELFLHARPPSGITDPGEQAAAVYRALLDVLSAENASWTSVVSETVFLRGVRTGLAPVREARRQALSGREDADHRPATLEIGQPPLKERAALEVSFQAVVLKGAPLPSLPVTTAPACGCAECATAHGLRVELGGETRFHAAGLYAPGGDAYAQTLGLFALAEDLLRRAGMEFGDVVRTWIHLRHMDRDYAALNKARREFFEARGIDPAPASTGIGGAPAAAAHDICLGFYAVKAGRPPVRTVMTSPTLNEASQYGADFVRGMKVVEANKVALYVSGTASIDEHGRTVHGDDFAAQADRMLVNIAALLERQGAGFGDVVSAITYLKHPADAKRLRDALRRAGFEGFPHAMVVAPICRRDLLCETEALAVLS
jgi:enamine deaminase RidA (YjgF/YER057c/UK114 family)